MLEDALDPVAAEGFFSLLVHYLEILTSLGFKGSLVEMLFMLLFDMII